MKLATAMTNEELLEAIFDAMSNGGPDVAYMDLYESGATPCDAYGVALDYADFPFEEEDEEGSYLFFV